MITLIGFAFDKNGSYQTGPAEAPPLIRKALYHPSSHQWTESGINLKGWFEDAGDFMPQSVEEWPDKVEAPIRALLQEGKTPFSLGGDHSLAFPIIKTFAEKYPNLSVLHLDAHPDIYHDYEGQGNPYSHASPFARIMEKKLIKRLVQVGVRSHNDHQREQQKKFGVECIEAKDFSDDLVLKFDTPLYITIDLDVLDPAFAPGVNHHEPGGLSTRQVIQFLNRVQAPTIVGADIVELSPQRDLNGMTAMVAAKLLKEVAGKILIMQKKNEPAFVGHAANVSASPVGLR